MEQESGEIQRVLQHLNGREENGEPLSVRDFEASEGLNYRTKREATVLYEETDGYRGTFIGVKGTEEELENEWEALADQGYEFEVEGTSDIGNYTGGADFRSEYMNLIRLRTEDLTGQELEELERLDFNYDLSFDSPLTD